MPSCLYAPVLLRFIIEPANVGLGATYSVMVPKSTRWVGWLVDWSVRRGWCGCERRLFDLDIYMSVRLIGLAWYLLQAVVVPVAGHGQRVACAWGDKRVTVGGVSQPRVRPVGSFAS